MMNKTLIILASLLLFSACTLFQSGDGSSDDSGSDSDSQSSSSDFDISSITAWLDYSEIITRSDVADNTSIISRNDVTNTSGITSPVTIPVPNILKSNAKTKKASEFKAFSTDNPPPILLVASDENPSSADVTFLAWAMADADGYVDLSVDTEQTFSLYLVLLTCNDFETCRQEQDDSLIFKYGTYYGQDSFSISVKGTYNIGEMALYDHISTSEALTSLRAENSLDGLDNITASSTDRPDVLAILTAEGTSSLDTQATIESPNEMIVTSTTNLQYIKCRRNNDHFIKLEPDSNALPVIDNGYLKSVSLSFWLAPLPILEEDDIYTVIASAKIIDTIENINSGWFQVKLTKRADDDYSDINIYSGGHPLIGPDAEHPDGSENYKILNNDWNYVVINIYFNNENGENRVSSELYIYDKNAEQTKTTGYATAGVSSFPAADWEEYFIICGQTFEDDLDIVNQATLFIDDIFIVQERALDFEIDDIYQGHLTKYNHTVATYPLN
ncbi:MAG: hypothetical protein ABIA04_04175 [Pseudomonadota bacterium]